MRKLPLILKHKRGKLSLSNLAIELEPDRYNLAIDLSVLEIKQLGWFVDVTKDAFTAGAVLKATLNLFGKQFDVVGSIQGKVAGKEITLGILASVEIRGGLNPFEIIGLSSVSPIVLNKILFAADLVIGPKLEGTIGAGLMGKYWGADVVVFVAVKTVFIFIETE